MDLVAKVSKIPGHLVPFPSGGVDVSKNIERAEFFVMICQGSDCKKKGAKALAQVARKTLKDQGFRQRALILKLKCTGNCKRAPVCGVLPQGGWLDGAKPEELEALVQGACKREQGG